MSHIVSADGGNITILAQKELKIGIDRRELNIHGNSERIAKIVSDHTPLKHYMTAHPYARLLRRIRQSFLEKRGIKNFTGGKQLLDQIYSHARN